MPLRKANTVQDCLRLRQEISDLRQEYPGTVRIEYSAERWSPVSTIVLIGAALPTNISPSNANIVIPISDLYGFAELAVQMLVTTEPLRSSATGKRVPFCRLLTSVDVMSHRLYYPYFRQEPLHPQYFMCLTPPPPGFRSRIQHFDLKAFLEAVWRYLREPEESVTSELDRRLAEYKGNPSAWLLARIGHLQEGLADLEAATTTYRLGLERFPGSKHFPFLLDRLVKSSNLT